MGNTLEYENTEKRKEVVKERGVLTNEEAEKCFKIDLENRFSTKPIQYNSGKVFEQKIKF